MQLNEIAANTARLGQAIPQKQNALQERSRLSMEIRADQQRVEGEILQKNQEKDHCRAQILALQSGERDENGALSDSAQARIAQLQSRQNEILREIQRLGRTREELRTRGERIQAEIRTIEASLQGCGRELQQLLQEVERNIAETSKAWEKLRCISANRFASSAARELETIRRHLEEARTQKQKLQQLLRLVGMTAAPSQQAAYGQPEAAQFWQVAAQEAPDTAGWEMPGEAAGGRGRERSVAEDWRMEHSGPRAAPRYTTQQEPEWQYTAQQEDLLRSMRGSPAPAAVSAEKMAGHLNSSRPGGTPDFAPAHYQARFRSSHPFGEFEVVQNPINQRWTVAGRNHQAYQEYQKNEELYYNTQAPSRICTVPLDLVEGIELSDRDLQEPNVFWKMHSREYSFESYREIARRIPDVKNALAGGRSIQELYNDPDETLRLCANLYFKPESNRSPSLTKVDDFYTLNGEGRHRVLAAWSLGYSFPMKVTAQYARK